MLCVWKNEKLIRIMNKNKLFKERKYTLILLSVGVVLLIIFLFYFLYFDGRINNEYTVTNSNIDNAMILTKNDSISLRINKPFDQIFLPIALCNTDSITVVISDGETIIKTPVTVKSELISYFDMNDYGDYMPDYWNNYNYYCMEGVKLNVDKLMNEFAISINCDIENGFILLGKQGDNVAYRTTRSTNVNYWIFFLICLVFVFGTGIVSYSLLNEADIIKKYTIAAVILGIVYFILFPATCTNDSGVHIIQTYKKASNLLGLSDWNDVNGEKMLMRYKNKDGYILDNTLWNTERRYPSPDTKSYDEAVYTSFIKVSNDETMVGYHSYLKCNTIEYLPYVIVMAFIRVFNINLRLGLGFAKLAGFLCYLFMIRLAIKMIPYGKEALALFALTPMVLQSMVSISYDLFCIGGSFVAYAYVLKISTEKHQYTWKDVMLISFLIFTLVPAKYGIYFVCFIFMFFFSNVFHQIVNKPKHLICLILAFFLIGGVVVFEFDAIKELIITDPTEWYSVSDLIEKPIEMIRYIGVSICIDIDMLIQGMFGGRMGWNEEITPWFTVIAFVIIFWASCNCQEGKFAKKEKICSIITVVLFILGIYVVFLRTTKRTWASVGGLQGRYFIPLIPLIICFINNPKIKLNCKPNLLFNSLWFTSIIHVFFAMTVYLRR